MARGKRGSGAKNRGRKGGNFSSSKNKRGSGMRGGGSTSSGPGSKGGSTGGGGNKRGSGAGGGWGSNISKSLSNIGKSISKSFSKVKSSLSGIGSKGPSIGQTKGSFTSGDKNWSSGYKGIGKMTGRDKEMSKTWPGKGWATPGSVQHAHQSGERGWSAFGSAYSESDPIKNPQFNKEEFNLKYDGLMGQWLQNTWKDTVHGEDSTLASLRRRLIPRRSDLDYYNKHGMLPTVKDGRLYGVEQALSNQFTQGTNMGIHHQINTITKAGIDNWVGLYGNITGDPMSLSYLRNTRPDDPRLAGVYDTARLGHAIKGGISSLGNLRNIGKAKGLANRPLKQIFHGTTKDAAKGIARTGMRNQLGMLGKGAYGSIFSGMRGATSYQNPTGLLRGTPFARPGLGGTNLRSIVPGGARTLGGATVVRGSTFDKGMRIAQKVQAGAPGAKAQQIRNLMNAKEGAVGAGRTLGQLIGSNPQAAAFAGAGAIGAGMKVLGAGFDKLVSDDAKIKTTKDILGSDLIQNIANWSQGESWAQEGTANWLSNQIRDKIDPGVRYAREDLKGLAGWIGNIQANKATGALDKNDIPQALKTILGTIDLAGRYGDKTPGIGAELQGRWGQAQDFLNNRDVRSVREILGQQPERTRRERVRTLRESGYGTSGRNNQMMIQSFDPNKINIQADPYGQAQAASDESDLAAFWQQQNRLNTAADERLRNIQSDRSDYTRLIDELNQVSTGYSDELARIQPAGQELSDELARLQPFEKEFADELTRLEPIGKQYTDEIKRLEPYDDMFRDAFRDHYQWKGHTSNSGRLAKTRGSYTPPPKMSGRDFINMNRSWSQNTGSPHQREFIKDYEEYLTGVENLHKWHKEHQDYLADIQSQQKEYQTHLADIQGQHKEYQTYLGGIKSSQEELGTYQTEVNRRSKALEDYALAFGSARQASDEAAKGYTIRSQQSISGAFRPGVTGIRAARGYATYGSRNRNRSPKKRFNRDFRIGSFGDSARIQPINV